MILKRCILVAVLAAVLAAVIAAVVVMLRIDLAGQAGKAVGTLSFFEQFVVAGGWIVWFVLLPMSIIMVYLAVEYSLTIRRSRLLPAGIVSKITATLRQFGPGQLEKRFSGRGDFVSTAVVRAVTEGRGDWFRMRSVVSESLQNQAWRLMRKIEWINLIGSVSPMVGLFGTVFGMIKLFNAIVIAGGQPQPAELADGISVALVTTFWGLLIAIPALAIYGMFRNRIETLASDAVVQAEEIMTRVRIAMKKQRQQVKSGGAGKSTVRIQQIGDKSTERMSKLVGSD